MTVADYMTRCLLDPVDGYYTKHVAFGEDGDFITAPMVSQMFGEMIGIWVVQAWRNMGSPTPFRLVEIGGGDGTLMSDILRVLAKVPGLLDAAARVTMIEPSPALQVRQTERLGRVDSLDDLMALPCDIPVIIIANEVLDCLPSRQFVLADRGWCERRVGVRDGNLAFGLAEAPDFVPPFDAGRGQIVEMAFEQTRFVRQLAEILKQATGAALLVDYGRAAPETGDTLQAMHRHQKRHPLEAPGWHDLTMWADFGAVRKIASNTNVKFSEIASQRRFLTALGIDARLAALKLANPAQIAKLERQYKRLVAPDQMGDLFKVIGLVWPANVALPGLEHTAPKD